MKTVRSIVVALLFAAIAFQASAQVNFGARAGFGLHQLKDVDDFNGVSVYKFTPFISGGVFAEIPVSSQLFLQPALLFAQKGGRIDVDRYLRYPYYIFQLHYLEVPINMVFKNNVKGGSILAGLGPYFSLGLKGNVKVVSHDYTTIFKIKFSSQWPEEGYYFSTLKPIDFGFNFFAGFEFAKGLSFGLNFQLGIANLFVESGGIKNGEKGRDISTKNIGLDLTFGYKVF